jgi:hypothetical protein
MTYKDLEIIPVPDELKKELHSVKYVLDNSENSGLCVRVLENMGFWESEDYYTIKNVNENGGNIGVHGFIYNTEVYNFLENNEVEIARHIVDTWTENIDVDKYIDDATEWTYIFDGPDGFNLKTLATCVSIIDMSPYYRFIDNLRNSSKKNKDLQKLYLFDLYLLLENEEMPVEFSTQHFACIFALESVCREFEKND